MVFDGTNIEGGRGIVRPARAGDAGAIARVHVDAWRETYPGILPQTVLDSLSYAERESQWCLTLEANHTLFVAEIDGAVVGFSSGGPNRDEAFREQFPGELETLYVLAGFHKRGLGEALFESVRSALRAASLSPFMLWTIEGSRAGGFYERMGGKRLVTQPAVIRGADVVESAYIFAEATPNADNLNRS